MAKMTPTIRKEARTTPMSSLPEGEVAIRKLLWMRRKMRMMTPPLDWGMKRAGNELVGEDEDRGRNYYKGCKLR